MAGEVFRVALTARRKQGIVQMVLPMAISKVLLERGLNRATLEITEEGMLLRPYAEEGRARSVAIDVPEGWAGGA